MKKPCIAILIFLLVGCAGRHQNPTLTAEQAKAIAMQLANDKTFLLYQCRPFQDGQPARFVSGHWIWVGQHGFGQNDIEATVELAANGSTNDLNFKVLVNLLNNREF